MNKLQRKDKTVLKGAKNREKIVGPLNHAIWHSHSARDNSLTNQTVTHQLIKTAFIGNIRYAPHNISPLATQPELNHTRLLSLYLPCEFLLDFNTSWTY